MSVVFVLDHPFTPLNFDMGLYMTSVSRSFFSVKAQFAGACVIGCVWLFGISVATAGARVGNDPRLPSASMAASEKAVDNIIVVVDASGSMNEPLKGGKTGSESGKRQSRMDAAKAALVTVLRSVPPKTEVGVLVFSGKNKGSSDWIVPLGPLNLSTAEAAMMRIVADGGTPLGQYLKVGADAMLDRRRSQSGFGTFRLLVVTDGEASDPKLLERHLPDVMKRGLRVDVIGIDMNARHTLANEVSSYREAKDAAGLSTALAEVFAEVGGAGAALDLIGDAEQYAMVQAFASSGAVAVLSALKPQGDWPIGEPGPATAGFAPNSGTSTSAAAPAATASSPTSNPSSPPPPASNSLVRNLIGGGSMVCLIVSAAGLIVIISIIRRVFKGGR